MKPDDAEINQDPANKKLPDKVSQSKDELIGDIFGGIAAMVVALPSAIAFGLVIYAPLGPTFSGAAAIGGILGTIAIGLVAPIFGGTKRLISAPCAPAAAVLAAFVAESYSSGKIPAELIPVYISLIALFTGLSQIAIGKLGGGKFIKYIPYPVVAGYLSGVGVIIFLGQLPKFLGLPAKTSVLNAVSNPGLLRWESIVIGTVSIITMITANRFTKKIPASIIALIAGILSYFALSLVNTDLLNITNPLIIGPISASIQDIIGTFANTWSKSLSISFSDLGYIIYPTLTLAVLLSIDTLKTCVVLDALTLSRHNSNKEVVGQGLGNVASAIACGIPGAGTMGATLVNLNSGARTQRSGTIMGIAALIVLLALGNFVAWIPIPALAGILIVVAVRMVDKKSFSLLKHKSTRFDFFCILAVVISAVLLSLITAAGVGIALAIMLFLREQIRSSVIKRKAFGNQIFSKMIHLEKEMEYLQQNGHKAFIAELQGPLFFGTTDQLFSELEPHLSKCKIIILDMKRVQSVDFTAVNMIKQILARLKNNNGTLAISSVPLSLPTGQNIKMYLEDLGLTETDELRFFMDLNAALEWSEETLLKEMPGIGEVESEALTIPEFEFFNELSDEGIKILQNCMEERSFDDNEKIFSKGEVSDELLFIRKGNVKIVLPLNDGISYHLATFTKGGFFGDMSFLDNEVRSADAVSDGKVELYVLSREKFKEAVQNYPELGEFIFSRLARTIAGRLRQSNIELKALQEN